MPKPVKKDWKGKKIVWWKLRGKRMKRGEKRTVCNKGQRNVSENGRCDIIKKYREAGGLAETQHTCLRDEALKREWGAVPNFARLQRGEQSKCSSALSRRKNGKKPV